jgi:hypothetical protein
VDPVRATIILVHPLAALSLIWLFYGQRRWRRDSHVLDKDGLRASVERHESMGVRITVATLCIVVMAFGSNAIRGLIDANDATSYLLPGHFHGWTGLVGLMLMLVLWMLGRKTQDAKTAGESFAKEMQMHGRLSELMAVLAVIHAFLGFLYLLTIL